VPGLVHLGFPSGVFRSSSGLICPTYDLPVLLTPACLVDDSTIRVFYDMLRQCRKAIVLIGGGCGEAVGYIVQFLVFEQIRFVTTPDGKGLVSPDHPLFCGVFGFGGHPEANAALNDPDIDLIIAIGIVLGNRGLGNRGQSCSEIAK
jgi:acetolactate synthase-1/2/3 large subunit